MSTCSKCKWWSEHRAELGICRRSAPRAAMAQYDSGADAIDAIKRDNINAIIAFRPMWPETQADEFCGDFYVKKEPVI